MKRIIVVAVSLVAVFAAGCAQLSQSAAGGTTPQPFSYPQNSLNGVF